LTIRGTNKKDAKLGQRGPEAVTWRTFAIFGVLHISEMVDVRNLKFIMQIDHQKH